MNGTPPATSSERAQVIYPPQVGNKTQPSCCCGKIFSAIKHFFQSICSWLFQRFSSPPSSTSTLPEQEIKRIFFDPPTTPGFERQYNRHMEKLLPQKVSQRLTEVKSATELRILIRDVKAECARFNASIANGREIMPKDPKSYDYSELVAKWEIVEQILDQPNLERQFALIQRLNAFESFEGPASILERMHTQFHTSIILIFSKFDSHDTSWQQLPTETLLNALKNMSQVAKKFDPTSKDLPQVDDRISQDIQGGSFNRLTAGVLALKPLAHKLQFIYSVAQAGKKNITSILRQPFGMTSE